MVPSGQSTIIFDFLAVVAVFVVTVVIVVVVSCFAAAFLGSVQRARDDATCDFNFNSDFDLEFWTLAPVCRRIGADWISLATQAGRQGGMQAGQVWARSFSTLVLFSLNFIIKH